jgi:hypothetical protein
MLQQISRKPERAVISNLDPMLNYFVLEIAQKLKHED